MISPLNILLAEKNQEHNTTIQALLKENFDCQLFSATSADEVMNLLPQHPIQVLIFNVDIDNKNDYFHHIRTIISHYPEITILPVIDDSNQSIINEAINLNLFNYLSFPYNTQEVSLIVKKSIHIIASKNQISKPQPKRRTDIFHGIIGQSQIMRRLFDLISRIADDEFSTVLIRGESGTGKELVAKAIHTHSQRRKNNFVPVNCAAIPDDLLESELFGHIKGAFTGANQNKQGRIQFADGGTLFLDEIGDMKSSLQAKLLRVLQEKEFEPVGALKAITVDTRIVAATHCDLEQLVSEGKFREDLYYRLSVIPLNIPSLRDRNDDINLLTDSFIERFTTKRGREPFTFSEAVKNSLKAHEWRGNVRELENLVQHMSILYSGQLVDIEDLPEKYQILDPTPKEMSPTIMSVQPDERAALHQKFPTESSEEIEWSKDGVDFKELINDFETKLIIQAMKQTAGNKKEAARLLNLKRTTLLEKIKKKDLQGSWDS